MKRIFVLGVLGGIFSFSMGIVAIFIMLIAQANGVADSDLTINIMLAFLAGALGIVGGVIGNKRGGVILGLSAIMALIGTSVFGIPSFVLFLIGGVLAFRGREDVETDLAVSSLSVEERKKERRNNAIYYLTAISVAVAIVGIALAETNFYLTPYLQPRARLTVSMDSLIDNSGDNWETISVPVTITNNSPRTANIIDDWNLTLVFKNSTFQFPNENCTYGTTKLDPAQETQIMYSYDITNNATLRGLIDSNDMRSLVFTISYIDDQGTQTQQFASIRPHS